MAPFKPFCAEVEAALAQDLPPEHRAMWEDGLSVCRLPHDDLTPAGALTMLQGEEIALSVDDDVVTVVARHDGEEFRLCCSLQGEMTRFPGTDSWAVRHRLERIDEAVLFFILLVRAAENPHWKPLTWRGPAAAPEPETVEALAGERIDREFWSEALGETRRVEIYLPSEHPEGVLIAADGLGKVPYIVERDVRDGRYGALAIIGLPSGERGIVEDRSALGVPDLRAADYMPGWDSEHDRFNRHQVFVFDELLSALRNEFGLPDAARTIVSGQSAGATFALFAALDRPEHVGAAIVNSPSRGTRAVEPDEDGAQARYFISGGLYEPYFRDSARRAARILREAGYDVTHREFAAGHAPDQWDIALLEGLRALLGARENQ